MLALIGLRHARGDGRRRRACTAFIFGLLRIAWIIVASIFLYNIAVETGQFQVMKESIAALSADRRLQLVLIAFCFGAFLEGTGGGGAPVAIAGSFLIGLGFEPFQAATLCLVANTAPVAWGGVGNPIRTLAGVTGLPEARAQRDDRPDPAAAVGRSCRSGWSAAWWAGARRSRSGRRWRSAACRSPLMQFYWSNYQEYGPGRHRRRDFLAAGDGRVPEGLAAAGRSSTHDHGRPAGAGAAMPPRHSIARRAEGLVAVHARVGADLPRRACRRWPRPLTFAGA